MASSMQDNVESQAVLKENLVVLLYASNPCTTVLCEVDDLEKELISQQTRSQKGQAVIPLKIDYEKQTWSWGKYSEGIGNMRYCDHHYKYGVIGVFNRTDLKNLKSMITAAEYAVREQSLGFFL